MKRKSRIEVIFFNITLSILFLWNITYTYSINKNYVTGTNTLTETIDYLVEVEDSLDVKVDEVDLDFGVISKHSTEKTLAKTDIRVEGAPLGTYITAKYVEKYNDYQELEQDEKGYTKIDLEWQPSEDDKVKKIDYSRENSNEDKTNLVSAYLEKINDKKYEVKPNLNGTETIIPIRGEIRDVSEAKTGKYYKEVYVYIEIVTPNTGIKVVNK